jgi:hypothetical protein
MTSEMSCETTYGEVRWELGLLPRLLAAWWFAVAASVPVTFFFVVFVGFGGNEAGDFLGVWLFGEVPIVAAAFLGFTIGTPIVDRLRVNSAWRAALRGVAVALLSYVLLIGTWVAAWAIPDSYGSSSTPRQSLAQFANEIVAVASIGALFVGWLIVLAGAMAGWLLFNLSKEVGFSKLVNRSRTYGSNATAYSVIAFLVFLANCAVLFLLKPK